MSKTGVCDINIHHTVQGREWKPRILPLLSKGTRETTTTPFILVKLYNLMHSKILPAP